ncbi:hypothetical protein G9A89_022737 [Geosiphon pyriformis]|nr:hypothetical protein G9A89_022737 [Geosiphon pyriformis]
MITTRVKSKKAVSDICLEISNKISIRKALSIVKATRQNILEVFFLSSNCDNLFLITTKVTSLSLASFSPVKVPSKRHIWVSPSVVFTLTKSPKVFNNRPINKLVFSSMDSTSGTKNSEKWGQSLASAIVTPNPFVHIIQDGLRLTTGCVAKCEAKQSFSVGSSVLENWADQIETESFLFLETITSYQRFAEWVAFTLVSDATFKIKLAYVKAVFQSVHGFLGTKSVLKDNVKLFYVEFASQVSLKAAFLVELTSSVHLATLKIAKSLVVSESGSLFTAAALHNVPLSVSAANIKTAFSVFGVITCVVLKPIGIWQYIVVYFENLVLLSITG